jgi:hypothetical protein
MFIDDLLMGFIVFGLLAAVTYVRANLIERCRERELVN